MPREKSFQAIIIKKQQYGEADEIITLFTKESGKVRVLAKSVKFVLSKLQQSLQPMFFVKINVAGQGSLPTIIGAQTLSVFPVVRSDPERVSLWFVAAELIQKALVDEQPNEQLFRLVLDFLEFLDRAGPDPAVWIAGLTKFKIIFFDLIGLQIHAPAEVTNTDQLLFSSSQGGFYVGSPSADSRSVSLETWSAFQSLSNNREFTGLPIHTSQLQELVNEFITYQLERELKAEKFLE
jgi:DNA repair protein RecO